MWPRLPRTLPEPPQCGHGTGPKSTSPAPRQPSQASKRTRCTRRLRALHRLVEAHARRLLQVLPGRRVGRGWGGSKMSRKPTDSTRTLRLEVEALEAALVAGRDRVDLQLAAVVGRPS